jgi:chorismate mutase/prephenate dehydratase
MPPNLTSLRQAIDKIDKELLLLLNQRAGLAQSVAEAKRAQGDHQFYKPEREAQILRWAQEHNPGPLPDAAVALLFREVMSACLALEAPLTVAYLGPVGTFSEQAAFKHFGHSVHGLPCPTLEAVAQAVVAQQAHYGVLPVENSLEGMVGQSLDAVWQSPLRVVGEVYLPIHHVLATQAQDFTSISQVLAHPQALGQCRRWLATHLPTVPTEAASSNAEAARLAAANPTWAAICGETAATAFGVPILSRHLEDVAGNTTRFWILGQAAVAASGRDKTSFVAVTRHAPGALLELLQPFAAASVNLWKLQSRPLKETPWQYAFFIDCEGHAEAAPLAEIFAELKKNTLFFKILGAYPVATW